MDGANNESRDIDGFRLGERIHSGAMGDIHRVHRSNGGSSEDDSEFPMIMKLPQVGAGASDETLLAFETEAMILPALTGPYVPRCVAVGDLAKTPYLVVEWVEGRSLQAMLNDRRQLPVDEVARVGAAIADALHSLHRQDAIHLDVKPDNVILRDDGRAVLIDFGLAHHARFPDLLAEEKRFASGSAPYVSPEQLNDLRSDIRSDVFALGVVLYEMATGKLPYGVPVSIAGMRDRLWREPLAPRERDAAIPPWLQEVILRCLEPDANDRYQSASHVAFDLRHPDQVPLTGRATRSGKAGALGQARRWWASRGERAAPRGLPNVRVSSAPVIMVAVDTTHPDDERQPAIRRATQQQLSLSEEFRLICVAVIRASFANEAGHVVDGNGGASGVQDPHLEHRIRLRHWVDPLRLPASRLSLHVMESASPEKTLLDFAARNNVDLIILGAPAPDHKAMAWWRSVASGVTAGAHCSVHVVRAGQQGLLENHGASPIA